MPPYELLHPAAVRPLIAGGTFLLAWALAAQAPPLFRRWAAQRANPRWQRLAQAPAWSYLGRLLGLAYALGALYLTLERDYISPLDIGLEPPLWGELASWLPAVAGLTALWAALLWGLYWHALRPTSDQSPRAAYGTLLGLPAHLMGAEAWAAILRGALIPALRLYWGAWAAALLAWLTPLLSPSTRQRLQDPAARPFLYLDWAMEGIAAGCFIVSGNLWTSLLARTSGQLAANLAHRCLYHWAQRRHEKALAPLKGQR